jgi:ABC-2 type transport system permease protein
MLSVELATLARRPRTWLLAALALALPTFFLAGMSRATGPSPQTQDPIAYLSTSQHGLALVLAPLLFGSPVFLPIAVAVISGASIGADASSGYLRYLLVRPVSRPRVYLTKLAGAVVFCVGLIAALLILGAVAAIALPHTGPLHTAALGADRTVTPLGTWPYLARVAGAAGYLTLWLAAFASIGVLAGLVTRSAVGGVSVAIGYHLVAGVLTQIGSLHGIHPALLPYWLGRWTTVGSAEPHWASLAQGAACAGAYLIVCTLAGVTLLQRQDVTS